MDEIKILKKEREKESNEEKDVKIHRKKNDRERKRENSECYIIPTHLFK